MDTMTLQQFKEKIEGLDRNFTEVRIDEREHLQKSCQLLPALLRLAEEQADKLKVAEDALELCRIMVEHEIMSCELRGHSANAWPDLLTGCVSGGGITAALAEIRKEP